MRTGNLLRSQLGVTKQVTSDKSKKPYERGIGIFNATSFLNKDRYVMVERLKKLHHFFSII